MTSLSLERFSWLTGLGSVAANAASKRRQAEAIRAPLDTLA
jgi:hypothetical protein